MGLPALHTARMRALLTAMAAETTLVGWLAGVALREPGELTDAEIAALADAITAHECAVEARRSGEACLRRASPDPPAEEAHGGYASDTP